MSRALSFVGLLSVLAGCGIVVADEETTGVRRATGEVAIKVADDSFDFVARPGELEIFLDGKSFATYVWSDPHTTRPYFKQIKAHGGDVQVTRNHPPQDGDFDDHETYHPGIWWGFGDVGGNDYWRMKAKIIGGQFVEEPTAAKDSASFAVRNRLLTNAGDETFCEQICRYEIVRRPNGILMICESTFLRKQSDFWLGDQEEMGLAFRVATPLTTEKDGQIRDSDDRTDLRQIRTHQSDWCDYCGPIAGRHGGLMLMNDPGNFRRPWWHAVSTGLLIANPLGESELNGNGKKKHNVLVKKGEPFRLRYGCLIHLHEEAVQFDAAMAYEDFLRELAESAKRKTAATLQPPTLQKDSLPKVPEGFRVSVFASEPRVYKPTTICFDAQGRLMVGQGPQYPRNFEDTTRDSVVILIDSDADGHADTTKTFATGFNSVQGLAWKGKDLYVANAPELTIVRDLDGDDEADEYVVVYTDLGNREHALHGLNFGPDGRLYMSKGNSKGHNQPQKYGYVAPKPFRDLWDVEHPNGAPDAYPARTFTKHSYRKTYHHWDDDWGREGGVLRCDPLGENLEIVSRGLRNPWDMTMDDGFNFLGTDNDQDQGDRIVMPFFGAHFGWGHNYSSHWTGENHLPTAPISGPVFPGSGTGIIYYTHEHFPAEYRDVFFINDWLHGTFVYRPEWDGALMQPQGGRWEQFAVRGEGKLLYRPTDMEFGPDGSIYVCGWGGGYHYDRENEGSWMFRITNSKQLPPEKSKWWPNKRDRPMAEWTVDELVDDLRSATLPVWRVNAQDELVRRGSDDPTIIETVLRSNTLDRGQQTWIIWALARVMPLGADPDLLFERLSDTGTRKDLDAMLNWRIQALRVVGNRPRSDRMVSILESALHDPEPRIRFEAIQAIWQSDQTRLISNLIDHLADETDRLVFYAGWQAMRGMVPTDDRKRLLKDDRPQVRLAALLSLQEEHEISLDEVLAIAEDDSDDRVQHWAMTWAINPQPPAKMPNSQSRIEQEESVSMQELIKRAKAADNAKLRHLYLTMISRATYGDDRDDWEEVRDFYQTLLSDDERALVLRPLARDNDARPILWSALEGGESLRLAAIRGLSRLSRRFGNSPSELAQFLLVQMETDQHDSRHARTHNASQPLTQAEEVATLKKLERSLSEVEESRTSGVIEVLSQLELPESWRPPDNWDTALISAFAAIEDVTLQGRILRLLLRIEPEVLADSTMTRALSTKLSRSPHPRLYADLVSLNQRLGIDIAMEPPDQAKLAGVLEQLPHADASRGADLFFSRTGTTNCAGCHRVAGRGNSLAPDLSGIAIRSKPEVIVQSILEPSATITEGYQLQTFVMDDGLTVSGAVLEESAGQIRIVRTDGVVEILNSKSVEERSRKNISAMPTGFALLGTEQVADVLAYLLTCRHGPK